MAASLHRFARSAPASPDVWRAIRPRSTSSASGLLCVWTLKIASRPTTSGGETRIWRSNRPGRSSAVSSFSRRLDAAITTSDPVVWKPSISTSSWLSVCSRSEFMSEPRLAPTASSSSMKMIAVFALRASANRRRIRAAPRPANISTNDAADWEKNSAPDSPATALASSVLPVPGGPCRRIPFGTFAPSASKRLGSRRNSTTSASSALASSAPATAAQLTDAEDSGLICCGLVFGISFSVRQMKTTSRNMKMIGAQVMISGSRLLQLYQCGSATAGIGGGATNSIV